MTPTYVLAFIFTISKPFLMPQKNTVKYREKCN